MLLRMVQTASAAARGKQGRHALALQVTQRCVNRRRLAPRRARSPKLTGRSVLVQPQQPDDSHWQHDEGNGERREREAAAHSASV